ncbi:hypothetical protein TorRG33x02_343060 [Trema orientale]|uniref:Uncharacterized protein n=1 Tax=Trema orientale TaxID=63057 RepID=A0A2P5AS03_TREOI|nr:hypothetical protein TorRG33x02_343060 [Trema orientale]
MVLVENLINLNEYSQEYFLFDELQLQISVYEPFPEYNAHRTPNLKFVFGPTGSVFQVLASLSYSYDRAYYAIIRFDPFSDLTLQHHLSQLSLEEHITHPVISPLKSLWILLKLLRSHLETYMSSFFLSKVPSEIRFFFKSGICLTSVRVFTEPSHSLNRTDPMPMTLQVMLLPISTLPPLYVLYSSNKSFLGVI